MSNDAHLSDELRQEIYTSFSRQGFLRGMDARLASVEFGRCEIGMPFSDVVKQQHGFFHGGAVGALADTAGGYAAMTTARDLSEVLTVEYKINFMQPARGQMLIAEGTVLRAGRRLVTTRVDVFATDDGRRSLCATILQTIMRVPADKE